MESGSTKRQQRKIESRPEESHDKSTAPDDEVEPANPMNNGGPKIIQQPIREEEGDQITDDTDSTPINGDQILMKHARENPEIKATLNTCFEAVEGLKNCMESNSLLPTKSSQGMELYANILFTESCSCDDESRKKLSNFLAELGLPRLACNIFVTLRDRYPEVTTWDRNMQGYSGGEVCDEFNEDTFETLRDLFPEVSATWLREMEEEKEEEEEEEGENEHEREEEDEHEEEDDERINKQEEEEEAVRNVKLVS